MRSVHKTVRAVRQAFTLIELMLVLVILAVLAAVVVPKFSGKTDAARIAACKAEISIIDGALDLFEQAVGHYPKQDEGLRALIEAPSDAKGWAGPYLKRNDVPLDPWKKEYVYHFPATHNKAGPDLFSAGPDGQESTADDIDNWSSPK